MQKEIKRNTVEFAVYGKYSYYGSDYSYRGYDEREDGALYGVVSCGNEACAQSQGNCGDYGAYIGLEQVGAHAGDIAYVVAYVVSYYCGVSGVILGDACLYLAYEVRAYVSSLGIDAAAYTAEQSHGGSAKTEACEAGPCCFSVQKEECKANAEDAQAYYAKTHNSAAPESDLKSLVHSAAFCSSSCPYVAAGSYLHAEVSGKHGERGTADIKYSGDPVDTKSEDYGENSNYDDHSSVFSAEEGHSAFVDVAGDLCHTGVACRLAGDPLCKYKRNYECASSDYRSYICKFIHWVPPDPLHDNYKYQVDDQEHHCSDDSEF